MCLNRLVVGSLVALGLCVASACGPRSQASPASTDVSVNAGGPGPSAVPRVTPAQGGGYLEGQVSIGPLQPVQRIGVPSPTPPAAACTSRGLLVYSVATGLQ